MALERLVATPDATYTVVDADPFTTRALVVARLVDGPSREPLVVRGVTSLAPFTDAHVASGGWLVITGRPELAVPDLGVADQHLPVRVRLVEAPAVELDVVIPLGTDPLPFVASDLAVDPAPTSLFGTATAAAFPYGPVAGARVGVGSALPPPALVGLRTPLSLPHGLVTVRERSLAPNAAPTQLALAVTAGATSVRLLSTAGCAPNGVLVLGDQPLAEHAVIVAVNGVTGDVTFNAPLRRSRAKNETARAYLLTAVGATTTLSRPANAGDGVLAVNAALVGDVLEVVDATSEVRASAAVTGPDGRWRIDGVRGVGKVALTVTAGGFLPLGPQTFAVDYRRPNLIDFALRT
jgi:hypothetical protein